MRISDWIPSISITALFGVILWLCRAMISARLTASVRHEYDKKLESFKADLLSKEVQIEALRSGAISALASRQAALDGRRIEAIEQIWSGVMTLAPAKFIAEILARFNYDKVAKQAAYDQKTRDVFAAIGGHLDLKSFQTTTADKARPFIPRIVWGLFVAYKTILSVALVKCEFPKKRIDPDANLIAEDEIRKLVTAALPQKADYINQYGSSSFAYLIEEIESGILRERRAC